MDFEDYFAIDLESHLEEPVYDRLQKITEMYIQGFEGEVGELIEQIFIYELQLQRSRLQLQISTAQDHLKNILAKEKRDNIKDIKRKK